MHGRTQRHAGKVVVYTAIFGGYDAVFPIASKSARFDHVLITDGKSDPTGDWDVLRPPPEAIGLGQAARNRWCKFFPHRIFPDHDVSIYVDGNIKLMSPLDELVAAFRATGADLGLFRHPARSSATEELAVCVEMGKLTGEKAKAAANRLQTYETAHESTPVTFTENGVIFRRHAASGLDTAMNLWWDEYAKVHRDQIALPWVLQQTQIETAVWNWSYRNPNAWFLGPVTPHLSNLPSGAAGRLRLFLKLQKLRYRRRIALRSFNPSEAVAAFVDPAEKK